MNRRDRPIIRCAIPECVSVGAWQTSRNMCPTHYSQAVEHARAAIARHLNPEPEPPASSGFLSDPNRKVEAPSQSWLLSGVGNNREDRARGRQS